MNQMRSADATTIFRSGLALLIAYMILARFSVAAVVILMAIMFALDGADGYMAVREESRGKVSLTTYLMAAVGNKDAKKQVAFFKGKISKSSPHGPRMDIAGDRIVEYVFWILFTYLRVLPLFVVIVVVIRHSFVDAIMGSKGTSSKMKSRFSKVLFASNASRAWSAINKFLAFAFLALYYISGFPLWIGDVFTGVLVAYILIRGAAEISENL